MKREVRERMAEVKFQQDVWERVQAAHAALDWRGVLKWDGRMEELMENHPADEDCNFILKAFVVAHNACAMSSGSKSSERASIRLEERRIHLLGRMERFRDQGEAMCNVATALIVSFADMPQEGERWYQRAREVGAGALVLWCFGALVRWCFGTFGALVLWCFGALNYSHIVAPDTPHMVE